MTNADVIVGILQRAGVRRLFGMPGGGSTADLIEAARLGGLPFTLAQTESGSAFMATAQAEITGMPAACIATLGPGAASLVNGVANALLDRVPLLALTDCVSDDVRAVMHHQNLAHDCMFKAVAKASLRAAMMNVAQVMSEAIAIATTGQPGPVHIDVPPDVTAFTPPDSSLTNDREQCQGHTRGLSVASEELVRRARRPVFLIGLGARTSEIASAVRSISASHQIPALVTYKAKGVVPDGDAWYAGVVTNGALERPVLEHADLFIAVGFDPVELLPRRWTLPQPVISISRWAIPQQHVPVAEELIGDVPTLLDALARCLSAPADWTRTEVAELITRQRSAMRPPGDGNSLLPHDVVDIVAGFYDGARATVDAGAHMFPVMSLWPAREPSGVLISNGLSTMGFALPAAIGAALLDRSRPVVAFTGDGGLLICLGELQTAVREKVRIRIIVFDDRALSLIRIKQLQRDYRPDSTELAAVDWCAVGTGLGLVARQVETAAALRATLAETSSHPGPVLIAATVSPSTYAQTIRALRG
jgi:acetolactate synthase I/II/III large subunit